MVDLPTRMDLPSLLLLFSLLLNFYLLFSPLQIFIYLENAPPPSPKIPKHLASFLQSEPSSPHSDHLPKKEIPSLIVANPFPASSLNQLSPSTSFSPLTPFTPFTFSPSSKFSSPFSTQLLPFDQSEEGEEKGKENYSLRDYHYQLPFENYSPAEHFLAISPFGGFNNQLDHLYYQIGWARALGRTLVLPLFSGSHHVHDRGFYPIELFLDLYELGKVVKLIKWNDFVKLCDYKMDAVIALDKIRKRLDIFRTFEVMEYYNVTWEKEIVLDQHKKPITSFNIRDAFKDHGINNLRCIMLNGINKFDDYDRKSFEESNLFFQIRNAVQMATYIKYAAAQWIEEAFKGQRFLAVHFRRGDFFEYCTRDDIAIYPFVHQANLLSGESIQKLEKGMKERPGCYPSFDDSFKQISYVARKCKVNSIFLSTNADDEELDKLTVSLGEKYRIARYTGGLDFVSNVQSTIDITINSMADCFLGNKYSSFSFTILTKRRQLDSPKSWKTAYLY